MYCGVSVSELNGVLVFYLAYISYNNSLILPYQEMSEEVAKFQMHGGVQLGHVFILAAL